jgi:hypothetical protein
MAVRKLSLARELATLPAGLDVVCEPARVYARLLQDAGRWPYAWSFAVTVRVRGTRLLTIESFAAAPLNRGPWAFYGGRHVVKGGSAKRPSYTALALSDFCHDFQTLELYLEPGKTYAANMCVTGTRQKKCRLRLAFIGHDDEGRRFRGIGEVELLDWLML